MKGRTARIEDIEEEIREIKRSWPAHTPSPTQFARLEALEQELAVLQDQEEPGDAETESIS